MMNKLPEHIQAELDRLIDENMPIKEIAIMMRLSESTVEAAMGSRKPDPTRRPAAAAR